MDTICKSEEEVIRDAATIEGLARSQGVRLEEVRSLYESALARMKQDAVILDFLPIFAARQVKEILRGRNASNPLGDPEATSAERETG
jgi:hypothetical protein